MDWEYYIDSDVSNSIVRGLVFYGVYRFWHKNMVGKRVLRNLQNFLILFFYSNLEQTCKHPRTSKIR
jgi:hypothetical protein